MWAVLYACEEIYKKNQAIVNCRDFFSKIRDCDNDLEGESKIDQGRDIANTKSVRNCSAEEAGKAHPDDNYYWRWINRNGADSFRKKRVSKLISKVLPQLASCVMSNAEAQNITSEEVKKVA